MIILIHFFQLVIKFQLLVLLNIDFLQILIENHSTLNVLALLFSVVVVVCCLFFAITGETPYHHRGKKAFLSVIFDLSGVCDDMMICCYSYSSIYFFLRSLVSYLKKNILLVCSISLSSCHHYGFQIMFFVLFRVYVFSVFCGFML